MFLFTVTLHDIVHTEKSLTLVFEYLERDLKQYMDDCGGILAMNNVKVIINTINFEIVIIRNNDFFYCSFSCFN